MTKSSPFLLTQVDISAKEKDIEVTFKPEAGLADAIANKLADAVKVFVEANEKAITEKVRERMQQDIKTAIDKNNQGNLAAQGAKNAQG